MKLYFSWLLIIIVPIILGKNKRALQKSHEKPQWLKWSEAFLSELTVDDQNNLLKLLEKITYEYLSECTPVILYDKYTQFDNLFLENLLNNFSFPYIHGQITEDYNMTIKTTVATDIKSCVGYILFLQDVMKSKDVIGEQNYNKVVVVARSSQWRVIEFLSHKESQHFVNLLVIAKSARIMLQREEPPYILYTHKLYIDSLGSSKPNVLTTWLNGTFTRDVNLFPKKLESGFSGHRFVISVASQPPFSINRGRDDGGDNMFDGVEMRLVEILSKRYNFTTDFREALEATAIGSEEAVLRAVEKKKANIGIAGFYVSVDKLDRVVMSQSYSQDSASFISLSSTALPKYRAILGPFRWTVWVALTAIYMLGIFPLAFSDKHTLRPLLTNPEEMENMFWYVFGTFTNCFTFAGKKSWSKGEKVTTRLLIGFYWIFTIILTASYTGSIIAFVTLPVYPAVIDTVQQLLNDRYQIGTLDKGVWPLLFLNLSDSYSTKISKDLDFVPDIESGLKNTTYLSYSSFFRKYSFLGSGAQLDYIVRTNFTTSSKRQILHISAECFVLFNIGIAFPKNSIYSEELNEGIRWVIQAGLINKLRSDVEWNFLRSASGKLLAANSRKGGIKALSYEDRALNLDDTQGMFLLLGMGYVLGAASLFSEVVGGCFKCFKGRKRSGSSSSIESNPRSHDAQTPREKLNSIQYSHISSRLGSIIDLEQNYDVEVTRNNANCTVHEAAVHESNAGSKMVNKEDATLEEEDFNEEINKLFENIFGEENIDNVLEEEVIIEEHESQDNLGEEDKSRNRESKLINIEEEDDIVQC